MSKTKTNDLSMEGAWKIAEALAKGFRTDILDKKQAIKMDFVVGLLAKVIPGLDRVEAVLSQFSTQLGVFILLSDEARKTPMGVLRHTVHQVEHAIQAREGRFETLWLYSTNPEARARMEAHAYAAELEVVYFLTGEVPTLDELRWPLEGIYKLEGATLRLSQQILEARVTSFVAGEVNGVASAEAIRLLRAAGFVGAPQTSTPPAPQSGQPGA